MELLDGRRLLTQEARSLEGPQRQSRGVMPPSSHETGFIQYLDPGIWHLAFYNDGKESEVVSFLTTAIGKETPTPLGLGASVSLGKRVLGVSGGGADQGRSLPRGWRGATLTELAGQGMGVGGRGRGEWVAGDEGSGGRGRQALGPRAVAHGLPVLSVPQWVQCLRAEG